MQVSPELCYGCFESIDNHLSRTKCRVVYDHIVKEPKNLESCPLFVTWTINGNLRGCIGCFEPQEFPIGLYEYAKIAAFEDPRFSPITKSEIQELECEVSLLHSFEPCKDPFDWEVGIHGVIFEYNGHNATFLPEVAAEQNWNKLQTLHQLAKKSGLRSRLKEDQIKNVKMRRYQSSHRKSTYHEYKSFIDSTK